MKTKEIKCNWGTIGMWIDFTFFIVCVIGVVVFTIMAIIGDNKVESLTCALVFYLVVITSRKELLSKTDILEDKTP